jgi:hypothetical protein
MKATSTTLKTKVEQLLTEARVIIPGGQALFGFQFIAMLTTGFDKLPLNSQRVHTAALCFTALNVIILMAPAALHRLSFGGEIQRLPEARQRASHCGADAPRTACRGGTLRRI